MLRISDQRVLSSKCDILINSTHNKPQGTSLKRERNMWDPGNGEEWYEMLSSEHDMAIVLWTHSRCGYLQMSCTRSSQTIFQHRWEAHQNPALTEGLLAIDGFCRRERIILPWGTTPDDPEDSAIPMYIELALIRLNELLENTWIWEERHVWWTQGRAGKVGRGKEVYVIIFHCINVWNSQRLN